MPGGDQGGPQLFVFTPTGTAKSEWDAQAEDLEPPCGVMGPADSGDRYFQALPDHPETVVFVELGSEIQIFDVNTLRNR